MNRRGFLIAASAPIVAVPASALAKLDGVSSPLPGLSVCMAPDVVEAGPVDRQALLQRYVAFLAHEHRFALIEMFPHIYSRGRTDVPMCWFPQDPDIIHHVGEAPPSDRARRVLTAVGL